MAAGHQSTYMMHTVCSAASFSEMLGGRAASVRITHLNVEHARPKQQTVCTLLLPPMCIATASLTLLPLRCYMHNMNCNVLAGLQHAAWHHQVCQLTAEAAC